MSVQVPVPLAAGSILEVWANVIWTMPSTIKKATPKTIIDFVRFPAGPIPTRGALLILIQWASNRFIADDSNNLYQPEMRQRDLKETIISTRANAELRTGGADGYIRGRRIHAHRSGSSSQGRTADGPVVHIQHHDGIERCQASPANVILCVCVGIIDRIVSDIDFGCAIDKNGLCARI